MALKTCGQCEFFDAGRRDESAVGLQCSKHDRGTNAKQPACEDGKAVKGSKK